MNEAKQLNVGLVGAGVVGGGVVKHLTRNADLIAERLGMRINLKWVCDKDEARLKALPRCSAQLTGDAQKVLQDSDVHVLVELVGGTGFAKTLILDAFSRGKVVVTANKALLAHDGEEVFRAAAENSTNIFYEASVCGGIPIIKALREGFVANRFPFIYGIVNGTCNYILTRMTAEGKDFHDVLAEAQKLGYAEADPSLDVDGGDSAHKATILASLAHGFWTGLDNTYVEGIRHVSLFDIRVAGELGYTIKLLAIIKGAADNDSAPVEVRVHPTLIPHEHVLASVNGVFNGVVVRGDVVGDTMFYGRGAGADATASAVISDLADAALNLKFGSKQRVPSFVSHRLNARVRTIDDVESRYYLRLSVADRSGVIAKVSKVLADSDISISSVLQREAPESKPGQPPCGHVPLIFMLHTAKDRAVRDAVASIDQLEVVKDKTVVIRVESFE
ncbi:MAG TPA: homoserine dehydrogenase [Verrucomicrobiae bacterium]|nr:homoserine dehydrogenase [Verrucomicrobiae bacterium]